MAAKADFIAPATFFQVTSFEPISDFVLFVLFILGMKFYKNRGGALTS